MHHMRLVGLVWGEERSGSSPAASRGGAARRGVSPASGQRMAGRRRPDARAAVPRLGPPASSARGRVPPGALAVTSTSNQRCKPGSRLPAGPAQCTSTPHRQTRIAQAAGGLARETDCPATRCDWSPTTSRTAQDNPKETNIPTTRRHTPQKVWSAGSTVRVRATRRTFVTSRPITPRTTTTQAMSWRDTRRACWCRPAGPTQTKTSRVSAGRQSWRGAPGSAGQCGEYRVQHRYPRPRRQRGGRRGRWCSVGCVRTETGCEHCESSLTVRRQGRAGDAAGPDRRHRFVVR